MADFQNRINREIPPSSQKAYLVGYIHDGVIDSVKIENLSVSTGFGGSTDLDVVARQVADNLSLDHSIKILSITPLWAW